MTQTPASGPLGPVTTPPMSSLSMATAGGACWAYDTARTVDETNASLTKSLVIRSSSHDLNIIAPDLQIGGHLMQKQLTRLPFVILAIALAAAISITGSAHHGWAGNSEQHSELTGTLEVPGSLAGPHATTQGRANGEGWEITMEPTNGPQAAG